MAIAQRMISKTERYTFTIEIPVRRIDRSTASNGVILVKRRIQLTVPRTKNMNNTRNCHEYLFLKKYEKDKLGQKIYKAFKEQESLF